MTWLLAVLLSTVVGSAPDCMIVEFTADNCGPCKQLQPALEQLKREGWVIRTVNVDREPLLVRRYEVESLPTLVLVSSGKEVDRIVGAAPYEKILPKLAKLILSGGATGTAKGSSNQVPQPTRTGPAAAAESWQNQSQTQVTAPDSGLTVRGQSPTLGAFPMLAAAGSAALAASPLSPSRADNFTPDPNPVASPVSPASFSASPELQPGISQPASREPNPLPVQPTRQLQVSTNNAAPIDIQKAIARAEAATVRIRVDEENTTAYGTGTVIDVHGDEALVLTCGHLFREMKPHSQLTIDLFAGRQQPLNIPAQLIDFQATPGAEDIGLLSFRLPFTIEPVPLLPKAQSLVIGQPAFSFGCDHGENPTRRDTSVKNINRYIGAANVEIVGAPAVGRSGGGLFDNQGRLIGVCNAADEAGNEGIYAAAAIVYTQIDRLGLTHLFNDTPVAQSPQIQLASVPNSPSPAASFASSEGKRSQLSSASQPPAPQVTQTSAQQLICIVRDSAGREQVVTIESPTTELVDAIHRQAKR